MQNYDKLIEMALSAREKAFCPYSSFKVGAAILCSDGKIYTGCNIENASYSATVCAERTAIFKAISEGADSFTAIAIVGGKNGISDFVHPCGVCRQVLSEHCAPDLKIVLFNGQETKLCTLGQLFPFSFSKGDIK